MGINSLLTKAPWERERQISSYKESFVMEQRFFSLTILFLLGENYVPEETLKTMPPEYADQVRNSVNTSIFLRALKHHFRHHPQADKLADHMMRRMDSYINITREAYYQNADPLEAIAIMLAKRVPPQSEEQYDLYFERIGKIYDYTEALITKSLTDKYNIM
jgi:hypothetical protein